MKVAVIGGGWYGCHIAAMLKSHDADVCIIEKNDALFSEASGQNQFRLHMGLHYARSAITRKAAASPFAPDQFVKNVGNFVNCADPVKIEQSYF